MIFQPASTASLVFFLVVAISVLAAIIAAIWFSLKNLNYSKDTAIKAIGAVLVWIALSSGMVVSGFIEESPMPRVMIFFALSNAAAIALCFSSIGKALAISIPIWVLVLFQAFRLPLELVLHSWALQGTIPDAMTWTGYNFDIIAGIAALICAPLSKKSLDVAWLANVIGFILLLNVARVATFSSPLPFAWKVDPPLQLALHFPYSLIVTVCVAGALAGHIILTRALLKK
jgi:hypothetical protein